MNRSRSSPAPWRIRWAERQGRRLEQSYLAAKDNWQRADADLQAMRDAAASFTGRAPDGSAPVPMRRDERIYLILGAVQSVEAPHVYALPQVNVNDLTVVPSGGSIPQGITVRDAGSLMVTNRRMIFLGPERNREWSWAKVAGVMHDPTAPVTLIQVTNRKTASGVLVQPSDAARFRFMLNLVIAEATGARSALVAHLDRLLVEHRRRQPLPPAPVDPIRAPRRAWWSPLRVAATAVAFVFLLCVGVAFLPAPPTPVTGVADKTAARKDVSRTAAAVPLRASSTIPEPATTAAVVSTATTPATRGTTSHAVRGPATAHPKASAQRSVPPPRPKPTRSKAVSLCGAPANPLGYTFCGGSLIRSPNDGVCSYFDCIDAFWDGQGYMIQCRDGTVSMSGGRPGSCSHHGGNRRTVYRH